MDSLPLVIESLGRTAGDGPARIADVAPRVEAGLRETGAVLLRGFDVRSPQEFGRVADLFAPRPLPYVRGISPRHVVCGRVSTSTDAPRWFPIPLHCELAYSAIHPDRILFWCEVPPGSGGETPLVDMGRVYRALDPQVRCRFEERGLRMIQYVPARREWGRSSRTWREMFDTQDRQQVDRACAERGIESRWKPDGTLQLISHGPAAIDHPLSGERIWFNSVPLLHASRSWELAHAGRPGLALLFRLVESAARRRRAPEDLPQHCTFADGSEISESDLAHTRRTLWSEATARTWRQGDVLVLDNLRVGHGRRPYRGRRRILAALGDSADRAARRAGTAHADGH